MISLNGVFSYNNTDFGYGKVSKRIKDYFDKYKIHYKVNDLNAKLEICLNIPPYQFHNDQSYKIGFTMAESTELPEEYYFHMNNCNEIWTASEWIAKSYAEKLSVPVYCFPHGVDKVYQIKHSKSDPFTFLFVGDELRSNEELVVKAFLKLYANSNKHRLIIKHKKNLNLYNHPNISVIEKNISDDEMIELFHSSDVFVYPSSGEGFGFLPLEAIASGLPTIATTGWSEYKDLITIPINSGLSKSVWPEIHLGDMFNPDIDSVCNAMQYSENNYEEIANTAYFNSFAAQHDFDWDKMNGNILKRIINILNINL